METRLAKTRGTLGTGTKETTAITGKERTEKGLGTGSGSGVGNRLPQKGMAALTPLFTQKRRGTGA